MLRNALLALLTAGLLSTPNLASADRDDRWDRDDRRGRGHHYEHRDRHERWRGSPRREWRRHAVPPRWQRYHNGRWRPHPGFRYYHDRRYRYGRHYDYRGTGVLGGALLGTAIGLTLADDARDDCRGRCGPGLAPRRELTGCYRIERGPAGREVRVALPLSRCLLD